MPENLIGDVRYSILEPSIFINENPGWVLLQGQQIEANSELGKFGITQLPDARGTFIRGMNVDRQVDTGDAEGNRPVGSFQLDSFKKHQHSISGPAKTGDIVNNNLNFYNEPVGRNADTVTNFEGAEETRPRNICLYIYIKIN